MNDTPDQDRQRRESVLVVFFTTFVILAAVFVVMLLTGPLFIYIIMTVLVLGGLIGLNYILWGRSMERSTAGEREEAELRERLEAPEWEEPHPRGRYHE